jgi:hypothetical protein
MAHHDMKISQKMVEKHPHIIYNLIGYEMKRTNNINGIHYMKTPHSGTEGGFLHIISYEY